MITDFGQRIAHGRIGVEQIVMLARIPLVESWELLRDGLEETYNDPNWCCLHVVAELLHGDSVLQTQ